MKRVGRNCKCSCPQGPASSLHPILHRVCKQKPIEGSRPRERHSTALVFTAPASEPRHSGRLQCRKERGSLPALSDSAASWREAEFLPHPNSSGRLVPEPSGMSVSRHKSQSQLFQLHLLPELQAWSKTGSESHLLPFFPTNFWGMEN